MQRLMRLIRIFDELSMMRSRLQADACRMMLGGNEVTLKGMHRFSRHVSAKSCRQKALTSVDGREIYFHKNSVLSGAFPRLKIGTTVRFAEERGEKGPQATSVRILPRQRIQYGAKGAAA